MVNGEGRLRERLPASVMDGLGPAEQAPESPFPIIYPFPFQIIPLYRNQSNPKFAERHSPYSRRFYGMLSRYARQNCLAERHDGPSRGLRGTSLLSANIGLRSSGRLGPGNRRFSRTPRPFTDAPTLHGHPDPSRTPRPFSRASLLFRQTAAPVLAFEGRRMAFFNRLRAPYADYSPPCTMLAKKVPWRHFQGIPRCGCLAGIPSVFHGIVRVSHSFQAIHNGAGVVLFWRRCGKRVKTCATGERESPFCGAGTQGIITPAPKKVGTCAKEGGHCAKQVWDLRQRRGPLRQTGVEPAPKKGATAPNRCRTCAKEGGHCAKQVWDLRQRRRPLR
jgi:hypothetical protein